MEEEGWRLDFDGAANKCGNGIGVVVVSPDGARLPPFLGFVESGLPFTHNGGTAPTGQAATGHNTLFAQQIHFEVDLFARPRLLIHCLFGCGYIEIKRRLLRRTSTTSIVSGGSLSHLNEIHGRKKKIEQVGTPIIERELPLFLLPRSASTSPATSWSERGLQVKAAEGTACLATSFLGAQRAIGNDSTTVPQIRKLILSNRCCSLDSGGTTSLGLRNCCDSS
ncbi:hypothetical protein LINPERPRIM_LOCUS42971 [Linum perenne]